MPTLALTQMFINLVATGEFVSGGAAFGRQENYKVNGSMHTYANGRQRSISTAGVAVTFSFQLRYVSRSTVDTLLSWTNQLVEVRDSRRKFFGVYYDDAIEEVPVIANTWCVTEFDALGAWHVGLTLAQATYTEGV